MISTAPVLTDAGRIEWRRRVAQEYAVCALAQDFARRLTQVGAPATLIEQALVMALDELEHAVLARQVLDSAGDDEPVAFDRAAYIWPQDGHPIAELTMVAVANLCLGETLAVRISHGLRDNATHGAALAALDRVVSDEPRHAALGWCTLDWLLDHPECDVVRNAISDHLGMWVSGYREAFTAEAAADHLRALTASDLAWGLATPQYHQDILERTVIRDWAPRLARRGIDLPA